MIGHYNRVTAPKIPQYHELMWPALQATKELGGSATVSEMNERAMASAGITEEQQTLCPSRKRTNSRRPGRTRVFG